MKNHHFLLLILALSVVGASLLDHQENEDLQKICGKKSGFQRKVIHGELAKKGEHPWAASVYLKYKNASSNAFLRLLGPGTIISPRHIIAFNTIRKVEGKLNIIGLENTTLDGTCEGNHLVLPEELLARYDFDFEHFKMFDSRREFHKTIAKATVINGCTSIGANNPMILELINNVTATPACISNSPSNWNDVSQFTVFGVNRPGLLNSGRFSPTNCTEEAPLSCAEAVDKYQGLCQGDFGGSAVARLENRYTMLGLYAVGNTKCAADTETLPSYKFVNIGYLRQEICETTGVCVPAPVVPEDNITTQEYVPTGQTTPEEATTESDTTTTESPDTTTTESISLEPSTSDLPYDTTTTIEADTDAPGDITTTTEYIATTAEYVPTTTAPSIELIGEDGEVIKAETFAPMRINVSNCSDGEVIKAERIDPVQVGGGQTRGSRIGDINIYIHLE